MNNSTKTNSPTENLLLHKQKHEERMRAEEKKELEREEQQLKLFEKQLNESKYMIFKNNKIKGSALEHLNIIFELLSEHFTTVEEYKVDKQKHMPRMINALTTLHNKDDFYDILVYSLNCKKTEMIAYKILIILLECRNYVPPKMKTKKFAFWCTEKLLEELLVLTMKKSSTQVKEKMRNDEIYDECYAANCIDDVFITDSNRMRYVLKVITFILSYDSNFIYVLHSSGFFTLINSMVIREVAQAYNAIYEGMDYVYNNNSLTSNQLTNNAQSSYTSTFYKNFEKDAVFAIERPGFDPDEIVMRNLQMFEFKQREKRKMDAQVHKEILLELTSTIYHELMQCFPDDFYYVAAYKPPSYVLSEMEQFLNEIYGEISNKKESLLIKKITNHKNTNIINSILIYYNKYLMSSTDRSDMILKNIISNINLSNSIRNNSILILTHYLHTSAHMEITNKVTMGNVFSTLEYEMSLKDALRVFELLKAIYVSNNINSYKPSYLIVLRSYLVKFTKLIEQNSLKSDNLNVDELESICGWIQMYFSHFVDFLVECRVNVAEIILSKRAFVKRRDGKSKEKEVERDFYNINKITEEQTKSEDYDVITNKTKNSNLKKEELSEDAEIFKKYSRFVDDSD